MSDVARIKAVRYLDGYRLMLTFATGEDRIIDLCDEVGEGVFEPLKDPAFFKRVAIDLIAETISWPNGVDLCPHSLYESSTPVNGEKATWRS